ncbi:BolA family protein [Hellea balneolensis]|uniref:BolA family protein n=1 Tax=Hellea balneolensis TaxID=287478 RepID=UPI000420ED72|nr:BolA family protein [Hellea balneolensis]
MGIIASSIKEKLKQSFNPSQLEVIDESHKHAHHRGAHEHAADGGSAESHFHVVIISDKFEGLSRLAKHRAVLDVLSEEIAQIHAFSLEASAGQCVELPVSV